MTVPTSAQGLGDSPRAGEGTLTPKFPGRARTANSFQDIVYWFHFSCCGKRIPPTKVTTEGDSLSWWGRDGNRSMRLAHHIMSADLEEEVEPAYNISMLTHNIPPPARLPILEILLPARDQCTPLIPAVRDT